MHRIQKLKIYTPYFLYLAAGIDVIYGDIDDDLKHHPRIIGTVTMFLSRVS